MPVLFGEYVMLLTYWPSGATTVKLRVSITLRLPYAPVEALKSFADHVFGSMPVWNAMTRVFGSSK
jgi:hypothetical protein